MFRPNLCREFGFCMPTHIRDINQLKYMIEPNLLTRNQFRPAHLFYAARTSPSPVRIRDTGQGFSPNRHPTRLRLPGSVKKFVCPDLAVFASLAGRPDVTADHIPDPISWIRN